MERRSSIFRMTAVPILGIAVSIMTAACASSRFDSFERDPSFLYGSGSGVTSQAAVEAARAELAAVGLARSLGGDAKGFYVTDDMRKSVRLPAMKSFISEKRKGSFGVVLRMPAAEWDSLEAAREESIRAEMSARLASVRGDRGMALADRLEACQAVIDRITREGLFGSLASPDGGGLFVEYVGDYCRRVAAGLRLEAEPSGGLVQDGTAIAVRLRSEDGLSAAGAAVAAEWKSASGATRRVALAVGPDGTAALVFPADAELSNQVVSLSLSTDLAALEPGSELFGSLARPSAAFRYRHFDDIEKAFFDMVRVPGGAFSAGAMSQDRKAGKKEAPRAASVGDFLIDRYPVTNELFRAYLEETGASPDRYPAYIDHPAYGSPRQPVIGVSLEEAERFAGWVSERFGKKKRLLTEDEYERAARGGGDLVYPWGDQSPSPEALANYNGNGRFDGTSPVGSFEGGKNRLGLYDMAGNVWEWTSTPADAAAGGAGFIVKGGSWMDGPTELRVSNRKGLDPSKEYSDVGFRLGMEVGNE
jgi:hypothetical protein